MINGELPPIEHLLIFGGLAIYGLARWARFGLSPIALVNSILNRKSEIKIRTPVSIEETERRILETLGRGFFSRRFLGKVTGSLKQNELKIRRRRLFWSNSFAPTLYAETTTENGESWIIGAYGLDRFVRGFMKIWFGFLGFWSIFGIPIGLFSLLAGDGENSMFLIAPFMMFGAGLAFVDAGVFFGRHDSDTITGLLLEKTDGVVA